MKNLLQLEVGRWLHSNARETKEERTEELLEDLTNQALEVEESSDEEEDSDVDNYIVCFYARHIFCTVGFKLFLLCQRLEK